MGTREPEGSIVAGEGQQGECGSRRDDRRQTHRLPDTALASHLETTTERDLRAATGEAGGNPQAGRRGAPAEHSGGAGSIHLS